MSASRSGGPNEVQYGMTSNPTHNPREYSRQLIQEFIRPALSSFLDTEFDDNRDRSGAQTPPLVVTELPGGGRVTHPHVVIAEQDDSASPLDPRLELSQHDFAVSIEIHGRTATEMFNLRGLVRGWFLENQPDARDVGFAELSIDGNSADWDPDARTRSWQMTVTGLVHTHPDSDFNIE